MADDTKVQDPEKALQEKVDGMFRAALEKHLRETGREASDPREDPLVKQWARALGSEIGRELVAPLYPSEHPNIGRMFVDSPAFKRFAEGNYSGKSDGFRVGPAMSQVMRTASLSTISDIRDVLTTQREEDITPLPMRDFRVRDLINTQRTGADAIHYIRQTGYTNNAATIAENSDPATATNKPQSVLTYAKKTANVVDLAHWFAAPRQLLADAAQLEDEINSQGTAGLKDEEDDQILNGDGTGNNMQGITTDPDVGTFSWSAGDAGDNRADAILNAMVQAWIAKYMPDGIVLHPTQWKLILKLKDDNKGYLVNAIHQVGAAKFLWGLPVALTVAMDSTHGLVGSFKRGVTLYDREDANVRVSDSHANFFIQNMQAILLEERLALVNRRPESFVYVNFNSAPA